MKYRQKLTVSEKNILKRNESDADYYLDLRVKRKISSNPLLQKNVNFLQTYNNLFRKPSHQQIGDAETYFKQTLRNEPFDLIRDLNIQSNLVKSVRSFENLSKRKPRSRRTLPSPKTLENSVAASKPILPRSPVKNELLLKELYTSENKEKSDSGSESDDREYFSPQNQILRDLEEVDEVYEGDITPRGESADINRRLDDILKTESLAEMDEIEGDETYPDNVEDFVRGFEQELEQGGTEVEAEEEEDEMHEVEKMIEQASEELQQVVEENQLLMDTFENPEDEAEEYEEEGIKTAEGGDGSAFKFNPAIDEAVLKELEDAEKQAKQTAKIIYELKTRVAELLKKDKMTESEASELEQKNKELKAQMLLFEEKTKRIQFLIGQSNLFENMVQPFPPLQTKHNEDVLPKVIVCGLTENNIPKIIVCDDKKKKCRQKSTEKSPELSPKTQFTKKLNECYCMQEKLAAENADLEGKRYKLQSDLLNKDQTVECLQKQLTSLQTEMRMVCKENTLLSEKLQNCSVPPCGHSTKRSTSPDQPKRMPCGKGKGVCPADIESRLREYSENTEHLEKQLEEMEVEVKNMQGELISVQKEREHLEHHRKMLCVPPPCMLPLCSPHPCLPPPCAPVPCGKPNADQQLRELKEQYKRLQDDFKSKLTEVAGLRTDNERLKDSEKSAEEKKKAAEEKVKELENELKRLKGQGVKGTGTKEQLIDLEQQLIVAKQRFREAQDELEELRALVQDQQAQMDDYRNKFLEAQQTVEEQKRQIDMMELENQHISEQVNLEIQRVKNQFQEKLQELMPLPDILKSTQMKLKEAQQMHLLAERNNEAIARELQLYKDKIAAMTNEIDQVMSDRQLGADEKFSLSQKLEQLEQELSEMQQENNDLKNDLEQVREKLENSETLAEERLHEITQLESQLESVREETARQISRIKDRCEIVRKSMQNQIGDLERQLTQSRAMAKTAQKDRDEIRQKMQSQINNLNENFEDAQMRIRNLQGHVNFLKNSYGNVFPPTTERSLKEPDPCNCEADY